jgi:hypothetical protein
MALHPPLPARAFVFAFCGTSPLPAGIGLKNVHCLRTVFNVAHRLADSLGNSWGLVVEVLYTLDKALPAGAPASAGKVGCAAWALWQSLQQAPSV